MDKKLLDALNNVSEAIALLAETLNQKEDAKSSTGQALQTSDIGEKLKSLDLGIKELQKDTKEILKNQKTIMDISKSKSGGPEDSVTGMAAPEKKKSIKDGVSLILLIAMGVIAIGLAFKIVGDVDFTSVLALAIALPLVAVAFEKIAAIKDISFGIVITTVLLATAITLSSFILRQVQPVGIFQLITSVFIAGMFGAIAFGIGNLIKGFKDANLTIFDLAKMTIALPIVMIAISTAIVGSSYLLNQVQPVGIFQLFTSIFIAAAFGVIAFGMGKLLQGIKEVKNPAQAALVAALLPLVLVGISAAIMYSSTYLAQVQTVGLPQIFTTILISIALIPISFALPFISKAIEKINIVKIALLPLVVLAMAWVIMKASLLLSQVTQVDSGLLYNIVLQSISLGIVAIVMGATFWVLDKMQMGPIKALEYGLTTVIISLAVMASSKILSIGEYNNYPDYKWAFGVGLSIVAFGISAMIVGGLIVASGGLGALALLAGAAAILVVAGTIVATAEILNSGNYGNYPSLAWSASMAISLSTFGTGIMILGGLVVGSLGLGGLALAAGAAAIRVVAQSIVDASIILQEGVFTGGPTLKWASGVAIALGAFSPIYGMLLLNSIFDLFGGGGVGPDQFSEAIVVISKGIVQAATEFNSVNVAFKGGPTKEWAEGVGMAIGAFAPVYEVLAANSGWLSSGPSVEDMSKAIQTISQGIVDAAIFLGENSVVFDPTKAPNKDWSEGVGGAIKGFAPVFEFLSKNTGFLTSGDEAIRMMQKGIISIASSIVGVSLIIGSGNYASRIDPGFVKNLSDSIKQYIEIVNFLSDKDADDFDILEDYADGLVEIADAYEKFAESVESLNSAISNIDLEKMGALKSLTGGIILMSLMDSDQFESMMDALEEKAEIFVDAINELEGETSAGQKERPTATRKGSTVTVPSQQPQVSLADILAEVQRISGSLGSIASDTNSIQNHILEKEEKTNLGNSRT